MDEQSGSFLCPFLGGLVGNMKDTYLCCASGGECFAGYQPSSLKKNPWVLVSET